MYNNDSDSLNAGAPDIRLTGNQDPNTQMASYGYDDAMAESRQAYDDARQKGVIPIEMPFEEFLDLMQEGGFLEGKAPQQNSGIMAAAPQTYTQNRKRQMAAGGGIMGSNNGSMLVAPTADGSRPGYGWLDDIKDKIADLIPNEIKDPIAKVIPNELKNPVVAAVAANYLPSLIPGGDATILEKLGKTDTFGNIIGPDSMIGKGIEKVKNIPSSVMEAFTGPNVGKEEIERVIGGYPNPDLDPTSLPGGEELSPIRKALATILPFGDEGYVEGGLYNALLKGGGGGGGKDGDPSTLRQIANIGIPLAAGKFAHDYQRDYLAKQPAFPMDETGINFQTARQAMDDPNLRFKPKLEDTQLAAEGGRIGYNSGGLTEYQLFKLKELGYRNAGSNPDSYGGIGVLKDILKVNKYAQGGRIGADEGGLMNLGGMEKDYRQEGGFVPIGGKEKADDVPARLSKNEFVFTADAVRAAGGGDIDKGAEIMENMMNNLEAGGEVSEDSQGLEGARGMFANAQQLEKRII